MPSLEDHPSAQIVKLLLIGDSGTGKTGALASLARAGYNLRIADLDNGVDILRNLLRGSPYIKNVSYQTFSDPMSVTGRTLTPRDATAWPRLVESINKWDDGRLLSELGPKDVFVVDSLNFAGKAAMRFVQKLNNRLAAIPQIQDYFDGQRLVENLCATLYGEHIKCNVICLTHIREIGKKQDSIDDKGRVRTITVEGTTKGMPETGTGQALSGSISRYFNSVLMADIVGSGPSAKRIIRTVPHDNIGLKNSAPNRVKPQYPLESGLSDFFRDVTE